MGVLVKWLMVMAVTGVLVILLQCLALARTRAVLTEALRPKWTYPTPDTARPQTSAKSSPVHH